MDASAWRQAWRSLRRRPAYSVASVLTLAFGISVSASVFSLVDTVLIKSLPFPDADRLVTLYESSPAARQRTSLVAPARLEDWNRLSRSFVALSGSYSENVTETSGEEPERLEGRRVAARFFTVFGMQPLAGRTFHAAEEQANGPGAIVISERFWSRRFNRDASAIGRALSIGGRAYEIVGVMPAAFTGAPTDVWLPAQFAPGLMRAREARFLGGIARLRAGVSVDDGARELAAVQAALAKEFPKSDAGWSVEIRPLKDARVGDARRGLLLLFGAATLLWLITVVNIAGLTLVQVRRRTRELAIRAALGASRRRVIGTVLREGLILAALGGVFGGAVAAWIIAVMPRVLTATPRIDELSLDLRALGFVALTSALAACAFSVVPAFAATRPAFAQAIAGGGRAVAGGRHRLQKLLVAAQVALSLLLVGSATVLLRSYYALTHAETGFDASNVVTFHVGARWNEDRVRVGQLQRALIERLEQLPHVRSAGMTNFLPATGATLRYQVRIDGLAGPNADGSFNVGARMIDAGYLRALRVPLVAGSWCASPPPGDFNAPREAMVNRRLVETGASGQNLVGRPLSINQGSARYTIAGVVGDLAEDAHGAEPVPFLYACDAPGAWPDPEYVARTADASALATDVRRIVRELDASRAVFGMRPLEAVLAAALDRPRLDTAMLGVFAAAAILLAGLGLYSLFMLVVAERGREMAVRLALGGQPAAVVRLVLWDAGRLLAGGIASGVVLTGVADRVLRGVLFGVSPLDGAALASAALTLVAVTAVAVAVPALRAARIAPIDALRE